MSTKNKPRSEPRRERIWLVARVYKSVQENEPDIVNFEETVFCAQDQAQRTMNNHYESLDEFSDEEVPKAYLIYEVELLGQIPSIKLLHTGERSQTLVWRPAQKKQKEGQ